MERVLNQEERLKRAEEIYYRRKYGNALEKTTVNVKPKKKIKLLRKMVIQLVICLCIYGVIYSLQSNTDSFSIDSINYLKGTIANDLDIKNIFEKYIATFNLKDMEELELKNDLTETLENEVDKDNNLIEATLAVSEQTGENENTEALEEASSISQMEQDAEYIKSNFSFIKPVTGTVTSRFGLRNPTTATVPKYHTGIDIGVVEGTVLVSAIEGTVELVSSKGDYRKSYKNNQWRCNDFICTL